jgi:hypothetical protein
MDNNIFQVARHIKWSRNKLGAIIIYDRIAKKTFLMKAPTGKEIWEGILRKATIKELVEEIKQKFKTDKSTDEIGHDVIDFIKDLANAKIIHILK